MAIRIDPEKLRAIFDLAEFNGRCVLGIDCGDGRLPLPHVHRAAPGTAIAVLPDGLYAGPDLTMRNLLDVQSSGRQPAHLTQLKPGHIWNLSRESATIRNCKPVPGGWGKRGEGLSQNGSRL
jgi:hypothetical protein